MNKQKKYFPWALLRNMFFAGTSVGSNVFLLILMVFAGKILGGEEYGKFSFALAVVTILATFMDFGINELTTRVIARDRHAVTTYLGNTFGLKFVLGIFTIGVIIVAANFLRSEPDVLMACYLIGFSAVLRSYLITARSILQGLEQFKLETIIVFADRLFLLIFGSFFLWTGYGLIGLVSAFIIARCVSIVIMLFVVNTQVESLKPIFDFKFWKNMQFNAIPFGLFFVVLTLYAYVDIVMLGVIRDDKETGLYNAAYQIYDALVFAPSIIATVLKPRLSRYFENSPLRHMKLANVGVLSVIVLAVPVCWITFVFSEELIIMLFGTSYAESAIVLRILVCGLVFVFPIWLLHAIVISINEERLLLKVSLVGLGANIGVNLILIPHYGMVGAASATIVGEFVSFCMLFWILRCQGFFIVKAVRI